MRRIGRMIWWVAVAGMAGMMVLMTWGWRESIYFGREWDVRREDSPGIFSVGVGSLGIYTSRGWIGMVWREETGSGIDADALGIYPLRAAHGLWERASDAEGSWWGNEGTDFLEPDRGEADGGWSHAGMRWCNSEEAGMSHQLRIRGFVVSGWWIVGVFLGLVGFGVWRRWGRGEMAERRVRRGLCGGCGYDMRGHETGARCPECGLARAPK